MATDKFFYFIGGGDVNATPAPQQETFETLTRALDFIQNWKQQRNHSGQDTAYKVEYVYGVLGIIPLFGSDWTKQRVPAHILNELLFLESINPDECPKFLAELYRWHGIPAKQPEFATD